MTKLATLGLLASSGIGQSLAAPVQSRGVSPSPHRQMSRIEQDMAQAMELVRRGEDPYAGVDWSKVDYSGTDYSKIDWSKVDYGNVPSSVASSSHYATPQAMPSPTLSSLGRAYESTFGEPSPLATPPVATSIIRGFSPSLPPIMTATPVPQPLKVVAPVLGTEVDGKQAPFLAPAPAPTTTLLTATLAATPSAKPAGSTPAAAPGGNANINFFENVDVGQNAIAVAWHGQEEMTFSFFANAGPYQPGLGEAYKSVTLQPGAHETVNLPHGWSGRVQKMTGSVDAPATWAEVTFDAYLGQVWYDMSYIRGYNGPALMYLSQTPDVKAGSNVDMLAQYPRDKQNMQPRGAAIPATEGYDGIIRFDIINFWRAHSVDYAPKAGAPERLEAYIVHDDDKATMTGSDKHLIVEWF